MSADVVCRGRHHVGPPVLRLVDVTYSVGKAGGLRVLDHLSLELRQGEILGVFGPNGCGKSSLLNVISGYARADSGGIELGVDAEIRMSYLAQDYAETLLPWFRARTNLLLPVRFRGGSRQEAEAALAEVVSVFDDPIDLRKFPYSLSGGQQQILALLRCLIQQPQLILLDEPFSAINLHRMFTLRQRLALWSKQRKIAMMIVSHNLDDLMVVCDHVLAVAGPPLTVLADVEAPFSHPRSREDLCSAEMIEAKTIIYSST